MEPMRQNLEELRQTLDAAPMNAARWFAVSLTVVISALDGYDVLALTLAAPAIAAEWQIDKSYLGVALASGLGGMAAGSLLLAPLADQVGRRAIVFMALILMALGTIGSGFSTTLPMLIGSRIVTGLGIGACMAVINTLAAEYANGRWRSLAVAAMAVGYPVGSILAGLVAAILLPRFGWPAIFFCGSAVAIALIPVIARFLPESIMYLAGAQGTKREAKLNDLLARFDLPPVELIEVPARKRGYSRIFSPDQRAGTLRMGALAFLIALPIYFGLTWTPQIVVDSGLSHETAGIFSIVSGACGIAGGIIVGWLSSRWGPNRVVPFVMIGLGLGLIAFGLAPSDVLTMSAVISIIGLCLFGSAAGLYAVLAGHFSDEARAAGCGFAIGMGRIASIIAPLVAGWMFASGLGKAEISCVWGMSALLAGGLLAAPLIVSRDRQKKPSVIRGLSSH